MEEGGATETQVGQTKETDWKLDTETREAEASGSDSEDDNEEADKKNDSAFTVWHVNVRGWRSKEAVLNARVKLAQRKPEVLCVNESFLDKSTKDSALTLEGYDLVARRDRTDNSAWGGVLVWSRREVCNSVVLLETSETAERVWLTLHTNSGPYLLCAWYRPPGRGQLETVSTFREEYSRLAQAALGVLVVGDLNVHNQRWLRYSTSNSAEGVLLQQHCHELGLRQLVREPTREENLLDLVLTNSGGVRCTVLEKVADHKLVEARLQLPVPREETVYRQVWDFAKASWENLETSLKNTSWDFLETASPDEGAKKLTDTLLTLLRRWIPQKLLGEKKSTHPWLNERVTQLVDAKKKAEGTAEEKTATEACSQGVLEEYRAYLARTRAELATLKRGSKKWWSKTQELLGEKSQTCSVPALKHADGTWATTPTSKANLLATTFAAKYTSPTEATNQYTEVEQQSGAVEWRLPEESHAKETLENLRENSATGPDLIPTRILKRFAAELSVPLYKLSKRILETGRWPEVWLEHWVIPLYKRKAKWQPGNYRGVHLTAQLAKAAERFLQKAFAHFFYSNPVSGEHQFAYKPGRGARDALALLVLTWIAGFDKGYKYALYCSDVSGAFDRVSAEQLVKKLQAAGVPTKWLNLFRSWLRERPAKVAVGGVLSVAMVLRDMVFQGTVWGPQLWNAFFCDASRAVREKGFTEKVYADDLNAYKAFPAKTPNEELFEAADECQKELHLWREGNQVCFDAGKESMHVVSHRVAEGESFKVLGVKFDCSLTMEEAVHNLVVEVNWKLRTLERSVGYHRDAELVKLYKARVLGYVEYRTPAVYHATDTVLAPLNKLQDSFLRKLGITPLEALMEFRLAPLETRRDMAMLGLVHRAALRKGPPQFWQYFCADETNSIVRTRLGKRRHTKQLTETRKGRFLELVRRSALGLVATTCYPLTWGSQTL